MSSITRQPPSIILSRAYLCIECLNFVCFLCVCVFVSVVNEQVAKMELASAAFHVVRACVSACVGDSVCPRCAGFHVAEFFFFFFPSTICVRRVYIHETTKCAAPPSTARAVRRDCFVSSCHAATGKHACKQPFALHSNYKCCTVNKILLPPSPQTNSQNTDNTYYTICDHHLNPDRFTYDPGRSTRTVI